MEPRCWGFSSCWYCNRFPRTPRRPFANPGYRSWVFLTVGLGYFCLYLHHNFESFWSTFQCITVLAILSPLKERYSIHTTYLSVMQIVHNGFGDIVAVERTNLNVL